MHPPKDGIRQPGDLPGSSPPRLTRQDLLIIVGLIFAVALVFGQTLDFGFVDFDDRAYIVDNYHIHGGLSPQSILWALKTGYCANWHPLTWMSLMLDIDLFGKTPGGHHLTNVLLHAASAVLLFLFLRNTTGCRWRSAFVAALFALHPLRAESVAWVAERKDVLSAFFWMLTMLAYGAYARKRTVFGYALVTVSLALGLMAKPMLVTLPCVLLLLDYWPLRRVGEAPLPRTLSRVIVEKLPLFALAAGASVATFLAQRQGGAVAPVASYPMASRVGNALVAYAAYLGKMAWPLNLACYYPHAREALLSWQAVMAGLLLAAVTGLVLWRMRRAPYLTVGWFWYLGTLVPVIGIVQVGGQAMADRYTYIPSVGILILVTWGLADLVASRRRLRGMVATAASLSLVMAAGMTWRQVGFWRNAETLFRHALAVTGGSAKAHNGLGSALVDQERLPEAIEQFRDAIRIEPTYPKAHVNLGRALYLQGHLAEALKHYRDALAIDPNSVEALNNTANILMIQGDLDKAAEALEKVLRLNSNHANALVNLGMVRAGQGRFEEAKEQFHAALALVPNHPNGLAGLGMVFFLDGEHRPAIEHFAQALGFGPDKADEMFTPAVLQQFKSQLEGDAMDVDANMNLGIYAAYKGEKTAAAEHFRRALRYAQTPREAEKAR